MQISGIDKSLIVTGNTNLLFPLPVISGSASATYRDSVGVMNVQQGDYLAALFENPVTVTPTAPTGWSAEYLLNDGGVTVGEAAASLFVALSSTSNVGAYVSGVNTTTGLMADAAPFAGTFKNACVVLATAQPASGNQVWTLNVNGSPTSIVITIALSAAKGVYCDLTHTAAVSANQLFYWSVVNNATATSGNFNGWMMELLPSSGTPGMIGGSIAATLTASQTKFWQPFTANSNTTESSVQMPMPRAGTVTNLCVEVSTAAANTTSITLMKNQGATAMTFNLANSTGAQCSTTGGPIAFAQGDTMDIKIIAGTSTQFALGGWSVNF